MREWLNHLLDLARCWMRLRPHLRGGRYLAASAVGATLFAALLEAVAVSLLVPLLSLIVSGDSVAPMRPIQWMQNFLPGRSVAFYVVAFCLSVLGAIILKNAALYFAQRLTTRLKQRVARNLRLALFQRLHNADLAMFESRPAGDFANAFLTETHRAISAVDNALLFIQRASIALFYVAALLVISWQLTLLTVGLAGLMGLAVLFAYRALSRGGKRLASLNGEFSATLLESFAAVRVTRAADAAEFQQERFRKISEALSDEEERGMRTQLLISPLAETVAVAGGIVIISLAYCWWVRPGRMLNTHLMGFGVILLRLLPLLNQLYGIQGYLFYLAGGVLEVEKWLQSPQHPARPFGGTVFPGLRDAIRFEEVTFDYPNGARALDRATFAIPRGATVALVGPSGSGKSTLIQLLLRFRPVGGGRITVDGRDIWDLTAQSWHASLAVVEQDTFLFHDTFANNIICGARGISPAAVDRAIHDAQLESVVAALPAGLDTVIGERGSMLSGGQRQRLAIARALVRDPQLLILDEATSALDTVSEREVQAALAAARRNRTVLVVAHRLSTIRHADHIVVLDQGRVVDQGSWKELEQKSGVFQKLLSATEPPA